MGEPPLRTGEQTRGGQKRLVLRELAPHAEEGTPPPSKDKPECTTWPNCSTDLRLRHLCTLLAAHKVV